MSEELPSCHFLKNIFSYIMFTKYYGRYDSGQPVTATARVDRRIQVKFEICSCSFAMLAISTFSKCHKIDKSVLSD